MNAGYGSCSCRTGSVARAKAHSRKAACDKARSKCVVYRACNHGAVCRMKPQCASTSKKITKIRERVSKLVIKSRRGKKIKKLITRTAVRHKCSVVCWGKTTETCVVPGGRGDPHLTGFDGHTFDFHGVHGRFYSLFGRLGGDVLVTKIRSAKQWAKNGIEKTYFDQFGLRVLNSNDLISVSLKLDDSHGDSWHPVLELNGDEVQHDVYLDQAHILTDMHDHSFTVTTRETQFVFRAARFEDKKRRHLDIEVTLVGEPHPTHQYLGLLGHTLNRALGRETLPELAVTERDVSIETAMRERFEVDSLFAQPQHDERVLTGLVRSVSSVSFEKKHSKSSWRAMSVY